MMRPRTFPKKSFSAIRRQSRGVALVIILGFLVLIFAMAVAFLGSVATERASSASYSTNVTTRQLGDMAVNLVQAQIQHASTQEEGGTPLAWASQPGMVRTFRQDGSLHTLYKLYSDAGMTGSTIDPTSFSTQLASWRNDTAHFTDLNAPVGVDRNGDEVISPGEKVFPILNPAGLTSAGGKSPKIDGFSVLSAPGASDEQPVPMPVRWLYVLKDGTLAAGTGNGKTATISQASKDNPIVGRIAFWTDDETCKININTAAHGFPWDIPRVMSEEEVVNFAKYQPTIREFQRYPGHPATTSLAPALGHLFGVDPTGDDPYEGLTGTNEMDFANFAYDLAPRIAKGGSQFATVMATAPITLDNDRLYSSLDELLFVPTRQLQKPNGKTISKEDLESARFFLTAHSRAPEINLYQKPRISMWPINNGNNGKQPSSMDRLLAFCSTINGIPYYFQREEPDNPETDINIQKNLQLRSYVRDLLGEPFPGFGSTSFSEKYGTPESNQIVTEIFDYIRGSNLMPVEDYGATKFSTDVTGHNHEGTFADYGVGRRGGQVSPIIDGDTKGFGRIPTINKAVLHFYVSDILDSAGVSLVPKRPIPQNGGDVSPNVYLPAAAVRPSVQPKPAPENPTYELETQAVLYFDFFDPMAGYPVSDYNFDLRVRFVGQWAVTPRATMLPQQLDFASIHSGSVRIPLRYDGYHGFDFNRTGASTAALSNRAAGTTYGYRLGGGRSIVSPLMGFLGFDRIFRDSMNNITGQTGADGLTDQFPLVSMPVKLHRPFQAVTVSGNVRKFETPPDIFDPGKVYSDKFADIFDFSGGTAIVELVVKSAETGQDHVIQTFNFVFPPFSKPVPAYAPEGVNQGKQIFIDANFGYRITGVHGGGEATNLVQPGDIVVSLESAYGDSRLIAGKKNLTTDTSFGGGRASGDFAPHQDYFLGGFPTEIRTRHAYSFRVYAHNYPLGRFGSHSSTGPRHPRFGSFISSLTNYGRNAQPNLPSRYATGVPVFSASGGSGNFLPDYDQGPAYMEDAPYLNRADEGAVITTATLAGWPWQAAATTESATSQETFYSPNKQMPGAGKLGSLPTGVHRGYPWQTLLFRPDPRGVHPGSEEPPDYLLLDLFWMPVIEPYAISEPFSTAGKINLNHQIFPFTYINRDTALRGLLLKEDIPAIPDNKLGAPPAADAQTYKVIAAVGQTQLAKTLNSRNEIDLAETIKAINARFTSGDAYRSEAEICTVPLIPKGQSYSANFAYDSNWWNDRKVTGDNLREKPYTDLVSRLTTKSNSYTIHYRVQTLGKRPDSQPTVWEEGKDVVSGEYRGSSTIERFINPNLNVSSWTSAVDAPVLGPHYKWRTLNTSQFSP